MKKALVVLGSIFCCSSFLLSQVVQTNEWVSFWSDSTRINHDFIPVGTIIRAYDPQGVLCGIDTTTALGSYGLMAVYRDDGLTPADEGAQPGDTIVFTIDGKTAAVKNDAAAVWTSNGAVTKINLAVEEPLIDIAPPAVSFGTVPLHGSVQKIITIINTGLKQLVVDSIVMQYHFPDFFSLSSSSVTVHPEINATITVTFSPQLGSGSVNAQATVYSNAANGSALIVPITATIQSDIAATDRWVSFWSEATTYDGKPVQVGDVIDVFDPQGIHCGSFTATTPGKYGLIPVYRDDSTTPLVDEGASPGDSLLFAINGNHADPQGPGSAVWTSNGDVVQLNLEGFPNRSPVVQNPIPEIVIDQDAPAFNVADLDTVFSDPDGNILLYSVESGESNIAVRLDNENVLSITLTNGWSGSGAVVVHASDADYTLTDTFTVTVKPVNKVPDEQQSIPTVYSVSQNYPNPFNPQTTWIYSLPHDGRITFQIFNTLGQVVATLVTGHKDAGVYETEWNATDYPSGVYFYRIEAVATEHPGNRFIETKKMLLLK